MNNKLDKQYTDLLQDILDNGVNKQTRNGEVLSVFGRQIRHSMKDGFPLLTTKKMHWKSIVTELLWFLRGDTNIKFLIDNGCHIWDGDAYKRFLNETIKIEPADVKERAVTQLLNSKESKEEFINKTKTDDEFAKRWGELGKIYGKQWRSWKKSDSFIVEDDVWKNNEGWCSLKDFNKDELYIDQIQNLINDLKTNPDSRRLMVNSWNVGELDQMTLPPCHYGFQVYTREMLVQERQKYDNHYDSLIGEYPEHHTTLDERGVPRRAISLMWNQRSVDTFLGLPFNIASYGLLLEIIAKTVNMVPDELIGNLGDVHLYSNHVEQAKEQIGREMSFIERTNYGINILGYDGLLDFGHTQNDDDKILYCLNTWGVPIRTREPYPLPKLNINTEFWPTEGGSCGEGPLNAVAIFDSFKNDDFCRCLLEEDIQLGDYQSHPTIKAPLSN
jgi:thymidylate synthase